MTLSPNHNDFVRALQSRSKRSRFDSRNTRHSVSSDSNHASVLDFVRATGESVRQLRKKDVAKYTDRRLLALSAKWSRTVAMEQGEGGEQEVSTEMETWVASLSPTCARLEVEGVSFMAFAGNEQVSIQNSSIFDDCSDDDDDGLSEEMESLSTKVQGLQEALARIDRVERGRRQAKDMEDGIKMKEQDVVSARTKDTHGSAEKRRVLSITMGTRAVRATSLGSTVPSNHRRQ